MNLKDAQAHTRLSERTLREYIRQGRLKATMVGAGRNRHWEVDPESLAEVGRNFAGNSSGHFAGNGSGETSGQAEAFAEDDTDLRTLLSVLQAQVEAQQSQLTAQERELEARRREVQELHVLLQQTQAALPAPRKSKGWWSRLWRR